MRTWQKDVIISLAGIIVLFAGAAYAGDPMAGTYGNTVVSTDEASGITSKLMFNSDGTYVGETVGKDGRAVALEGHWSLKDGGKSICMHPDAAPNAKEAITESCGPLEMHHVGDRWKVTDDKKQTFDVTIVAGH